MVVSIGEISYGYLLPVITLCNVDKVSNRYCCCCCLIIPQRNPNKDLVVSRDLLGCKDIDKAISLVFTELVISVIITKA
jgi:hypothetical protein